MSFSAFYAVRFSPAPELGEWLNVAVVGEGISEHKAGIIVTDSMQRIEAAFGADAAERVRGICQDLTHLVAAMASAHDRGETTQPIPTAMKDQALSLSFSEQIVVFEGSFEDALSSIAMKYLSPTEIETSQANQLEVLISERPKAENDRESDLSRIASSIQSRLAKFSREVFPATIAKSLEQGQKAIESMVHGQEVSTVLVIGGAGHLGSALLPRLVNSGKRVRQLDPKESGSAVVEMLHPNVSRGISIAEVAKKSGVSLGSVTEVLSGATDKLRVSPKTADRIREIANTLGYRADDPGLTSHQSDDVETSMEGVDIVIYIPDGGLEHLATDSEALSDGKVYAKTAKELGVKRFVFVGSCQPGEKDNSGLEQELHELADDAFTITLLQLGDLYGHASATQWFGDLHDSAGRIKPFQPLTRSPRER